MGIAENVALVKAEIQAAVQRAGRQVEPVTLVAVTKKHTVEEIQTLLSLGIEHIGENKVQELLDKYQALGEGPVWHMIGHLQRNKVKYIADKVTYIHSLESLELAQEIEKRAARLGKVIQCLVEVNISGEVSKYGLKPEAVGDFLKSLEGLPHVRVVGLMTMAPYTEVPEETRSVFYGLKKLAEEIRSMNLDHVEMKHLSMGMSNDFFVAVEEGATLVRIGSRLFETDEN